MYLKWNFKILFYFVLFNYSCPNLPPLLSPTPPTPKIEILNCWPQMESHYHLPYRWSNHKIKYQEKKNNNKILKFYLNPISFWQLWAEPCFLFLNKWDVKDPETALAGVAQWTECQLTNQRIVGSIPGWGHTRGNHTLMFLSLSFSLLSAVSTNK